MIKKIDHFRYELKRRRKLVYVGITKDPELKQAQHRQEGKRFTRMHIVGPSVSKEMAEKWKDYALRMYKRSHNGQLPEYNQVEE